MEDMLMQELSVDALFKFLDYLKKANFMKATTISARKAAVRKIFLHSTKEEFENVIEVDIEELSNRLTGVAASTRDTYESRVQSSIEEFKRYLASPEQYKPDVLSRNRLAHGQILDSQQKLGSIEIPIRSNLTVSITGLPFDLSKSEAKKISGIILAMSPTSEGDKC